MKARNDRPHEDGAAATRDEAAVPPELADIEDVVLKWRRGTVSPEALLERLAEAIAREREACASIVDGFGAMNPLWAPATEQIAAAIRNRGPVKRGRTDAELANQLIRTFLSLNAGRYFCDLCLAYELKISPRVAHKSTQKLSDEPGFDHAVHWCHRCSARRTVSGFVPGAPRAH